MSRILDRMFRASQVFRSYPFCHSRPDRSFSFQGRRFGLCARCATMYLGGFLAMAAVPIWSILPPNLLLIFSVGLLLPGGIDGLTQMFCTRESTNQLRAVTGVLLGIGLVLGVYGITVGITP